MGIPLPGKTVLLLKPGTISIKRCCLTSIGIPIIEIRRSDNHPNFIMEMPILGRAVFILKPGLWYSCYFVSPGCCLGEACGWAMVPFRTWAISGQWKTEKEKSKKNNIYAYCIYLLFNNSDCAPAQEVILNRKETSCSVQARGGLCGISPLFSQRPLNFIRLPGGHFKKAYELLNLRAVKFSPVNKMHIFQCMGKIFLKYLTRTLKETIVIQHWNFKSS